MRAARLCGAHKKKGFMLSMGCQPCFAPSGQSARGDCRCLKAYWKSLSKEFLLPPAPRACECRGAPTRSAEKLGQRQLKCTR